jgi:hypothetical protein
LEIQLNYKKMVSERKNELGNNQVTGNLACDLAQALNER